MWGRFRKSVKEWDPVRVENRVEAGTPDVNLANGIWVELKWVRKAPKRGGIVVLDHYTAQQQCWHIRRHHAGGKVFILLKVANEWFLYYGHEAPEFLGKVDLETLRKKAIGKWKSKLNDAELRELLTSS